MRNSLKLRLNQKPDFRFVIGTMFTLSVLFGIISVAVQMGSVNDASASTSEEAFAQGSLIVNLQENDQNASKSIKAYGMIYDLIQNYKVPVKWIMPHAEENNQTAFKYNSVSYNKGAFIISSSFITKNIAERIAYWQSQGLISEFSSSALSASVDATLTSFPTIMIDSTSPEFAMIEAYYLSAMIPPVAYKKGNVLSQAPKSQREISPPTSASGFFKNILEANLTTQLNVMASIPANLKVGQNSSVHCIITGGGEPYVYEWSSSLGGTFLNPNDSSTSYTSPLAINDTVDVVRVKVTDKNGKTNFQYRCVSITSAALPVDLLSFTAYKKDDIVLLNWSTASEISNDFFSIERSVDGKTWSLLGKLKGKGNSSNTEDYLFMDREPVKDLSYYRLSQTDYYGKSEGFRILRLNPAKGLSQKSNLLNVSPNPFKESFSFEIHSPLSESAEMSLFTAQGDVIVKRTYAMRNGSNKLFFSDNGLLSEGTYYIAVKSESGKLFSSKIVKR